MDIVDGHLIGSFRNGDTFFDIGTSKFGEHAQVFAKYEFSEPTKAADVKRTCGNAVLNDQLKSMTTNLASRFMGNWWIYRRTLVETKISAYFSGFQGRQG